MRMWSPQLAFALDGRAKLATTAMIAAANLSAERRVASEFIVRRMGGQIRIDFWNAKGVPVRQRQHSVLANPHMLV
jgi:hypothetical protein